eukprot:1129175-Prymnesium_polylepis.2
MSDCSGVGGHGALKSGTTPDACRETRARLLRSTMCPRIDGKMFRMQDAYGHRMIVTSCITRDSAEDELPAIETALCPKRPRARLGGVPVWCQLPKSEMYLTVRISYLSYRLRATG